MKISRLIIVIAIALLVNSCANFQAKRLQKANALFEAAQYFKAKDKFEKFYGKTRDKEERAQYAMKVAECYRNMNLPAKQVNWYKRALKSKTPDVQANLYLANAYRMLEKYDEATVEYETYLKQYPDDPIAKNGLESCKISADWKKNPTRYIVEIVKDINSKESDFAPAYARPDFSEIYFTSSREASKGTQLNTVSGVNFTDIFKTFVDRKGKWSEPTVVTSIVSEADEGAVCFTNKMKTIYFTKCPVDKGTMGCKIYSATKTDDGWSKPEPVELFKDSSLSVGHPAVTQDDNTIYFVANNIKGGVGGRDIWMATRTGKGKGFGKPVCLGTEINTTGDEMYPFVREDGTLYFSSNGWLGMGGLDIFKATKNDENKWVIENMKSPINSAGDDFGICFQGNDEKGLFTSNRSGGKGSDDIYSFALPAMTLKMAGIVKNETTGGVIEGAVVKLIGSDGSQFEKTTEKDGTFKFDLKQNTDYLVVSSKDTPKEKYLVGKARETTKGLKEDKTITVELTMSQIILNETRELPNIEYDLDKTDLRPESMVTLDKLVELMTDNQNITIELGSHTDYRGDSLYNMNLSFGRAQSVVNYLVSKGIDSLRVKTAGYGESVPYKMKKKDSEKFTFLKEGTVLSEEFITSLESVDQQEICNQINRRTEFKILSWDYVPKQKSNSDKTKRNDNPPDDSNK